MNPIIKQIGLLLVALIGLLMIIVGFTSDSPSNGFLATTAIVCVVGLVGYLVMNYVMGDD